MKPAKLINPPDAIRVLKIGTCPTLSGKSKLTYQVGCNAKSEVQLCIAGNTGGGFFNNDWVSLEALQQQLDKGPSDKPITSHALYPIFRGRSINTPAFLMAVLKHEGFVSAKDKQRSYDRLEPKAFMAEVKALMASKVSLAPAAPVTPKAAPVTSAAVIAKPQAADSKALPIDKPKPATPTKPVIPAKPVIRGKQFTAGKKPMEKVIAKSAAKATGKAKKK